jgi:hypothetical protein
LTFSLLFDGFHLNPEIKTRNTDFRIDMGDQVCQ